MSSSGQNQDKTDKSALYREEFKKPLNEIKEDIFFRGDNFENEAWYDDFMLYTSIGVCQPSPEHILEVQKALKIMGYATHTSENDGKKFIAPGEVNPVQHQSKAPQRYEKER